MYIQYNTFNLSYTFDNFIVGECNNIAIKAAQAVVEAPCKVHNPLYLFGGSGTGKTHLFHAMGHDALVHHKNLKISCIPCEIFTKDLISELVRKGNTDNIIYCFSPLDLIMIEDLQYLHLKERTQEVVFGLLQSLVCLGKQIVLSSDRPHQMLPNLRINKIEKAFAVGIGPLDVETSFAFLKNRVRGKKVTVSEELLYFIGSQGNFNFFQLDGILNRIVAMSHFIAIPIDFEIVRSVLQTFEN